MSQTYTDNCFEGSHAAKTDLQNMENNFAALKSGFSGTSSPSNLVGGMTWHDSTGRKVRNYFNTAWLANLMGDASQKMYVYRNDTCEGWLVDSSVTDRVLAVKGGGYGTVGGIQAWTWVITGLTMTGHAHEVPGHLHKIYDISNPSSLFGFNSSGAAVGIGETTTISAANIAITSALGESGLNNILYTAANSSFNTLANADTVNSSGAWRPAALVGTMQYPDLS